MEVKLKVIGVTVVQNNTKNNKGNHLFGCPSLYSKIRLIDDTLNHTIMS